MPTINDLPLITLAVPANLPRKGRWVDNGSLSNLTPGEATIRYRSVATRYVEPAYVAAKAPDAPFTHPSGRILPFHQLVAATDLTRVKPLGKPLSRGGLVEARHDWEDVCVGAMASFTAQKFAIETLEARWLTTQRPADLVEWTNWGDERWGVAFQDGARQAKGRNALVSSVIDFTANL